MIAFEPTTAGATSRIITFDVFDSSSTTGARLAGLTWNSAGLIARYDRIGAAGASTAITLAPMTKGTWVSGGFVAADATNMPGVYQLGIPNAALAAGVTAVHINLYGAANMVPVNIRVPITAASTIAYGDGTTRVMVDTNGIDAALSATHGAGSWSGGADFGNDRCTLTVTDNDGIEIPDCTVFVSSDVGGVVTSPRLVTNSVGQAQFYLTHGNTYYCWREKTGYLFTNPVQFVAARD